MYISPSHTDARIGGFTLVETLVAISILLMVIIGPMTIAQRGIQSAYYANEQATAVFLAQEAIESIYRLRDNNALSVGYPNPNPTADTWSWISSVPAECKNASIGCDAHFTNAGNVTYESCAISSNCKLKQNLAASPAYGYDVSMTEVSPFTRKIFIENPGVSPDNSVKVKVEVTWYSNALKHDKTITLQSWVYDHYNRTP